MKKHLFLLLALVFAMTAHAQTGYYTRQYNDVKLNKAAQKWLKNGEWRFGFNKANPDASVNAVEFYLQYLRNPGQWEALFRWIAQTDLLSIPAGRHPIEGTQLVASVEDSQNGPLEKRNSENHFQHIDFQYVVKGVERFGLLDHNSSWPKDQWKPDVMHYHYDASRVRFVDSRPDRFFIFFPDDRHIAKVNNDSDNQDIRVIVIKVDYVAGE